MSQWSLKLHTVKHVTVIHITVMRNTMRFDNSMLGNVVYVLLSAGVSKKK